MKGVCPLARWISLAEAVSVESGKLRSTLQPTLSTDEGITLSVLKKDLSGTSEHSLRTILRITQLGFSAIYSPKVK